MEPRKARVAIKYDNKDITKDLAKYLKSVEITDNMDGKADDLSITLEDREGLWESSWFPDMGAVLSVSVICSNWDNAETEAEQDFGLFEIDEITTSGKPSNVQIKAVSVPDNNELRGVNRSRSWEKAELKRIAQDIADGAKMDLFYDLEDNPIIDRAEQTQQSDLSFLMQLCQDQGACLKITKNRIVIFEAKKMEAEPANLTVFKTFSCSSYSLRTKIRDVYSSCHVKYQDSKTKSVIEYTFSAPNKKGKILEINEQVKNVSEAEKLAKARLREKNQDEWAGNFSLMGNIDMLASKTVNISGFGKFDGKYIITSARHSFNNGYTTSVEARRCLDGY